MLLPLVTFLLVAFLLSTRVESGDARRVLVRAAVLCGTYAVLMTELLSLLRAVTRAGLAFAWAMPAIAAGVYMWRAGADLNCGKIQGIAWPESWPDRVLLLSVATILVLTGFVAWLAPPNTWDSLTYHMSRVAHWAQERGVIPYATGIERQNLMSPGAELLVLQTYVLSQGDHLANFVQWFAMLISLVGVSLVAKDLGADGKGQIFAVVFAATLPMGIAQATSTMTDYVLALWMIAVASEFVTLSQAREDRTTPMFLGLSAGLAILTKPTAFAYLLPFAAFIGIYLLIRGRWKELLAWGGLPLLLVGLVNAGYFGRNMALYGNPIGMGETVSTHQNQILDGRVLLSNVLRNASLHAGTPSPYVNKAAYLALARIHRILDLELTDPRISVHESFKVSKPSLDEKKAGNLLQGVLMMITFGIILVRWGRAPGHLRAYALATTLTFLAISAIFKFTIFGSRYHLPFFVLSAPAVGATLAARWDRRITFIIGIAMLIYSWSWLVGLDQRPLIAQDSEPGLLTAPRESFYLPASYMTIFREMARLIKGAECWQVGIAIAGDGPEYPFWVLLGAPREPVEIEWIISDQAPSAAYRKTDFEPCALICDKTCPGEWQAFRGMPIALERAGYRIYMSQP